MPLSKEEAQRILAKSQAAEKKKREPRQPKFDYTVRTYQGWFTVALGRMRHRQCGFCGTSRMCVQLPGERWICRLCYLRGDGLDSSS
jgi:hypothetical protein